ncbi:hypothetical protein MNEG_8928, partial [Monoraphidium neglectum]
ALERYRDAVTNAYSTALSLPPESVAVQSVDCKAAAGAPAAAGAGAEAAASGGRRRLMQPGAPAAGVTLDTRFTVQVPTDPPELRQQVIYNITNNSADILGPAIRGVFGRDIGGVSIGNPSPLPAGGDASIPGSPQPSQAAGVDLPPAPAAQEPSEPEPLPSPRLGKRYPAAPPPQPPEPAPPSPEPGGSPEAIPSSQPLTPPTAASPAPSPATAPPARASYEGREPAHPKWSDAPRCSYQPAAGGQYATDAAGRLWGWEAGKSCTFQQPDTGLPIIVDQGPAGAAPGGKQQQQQQNQAQTKDQQQQRPDWASAPACKYERTATNSVQDTAGQAYARTADNSVQDTIGRPWGWQDRRSCKFA